MSGSRRVRLHRDVRTVLCGGAIGGIAGSALGTIGAIWMAWIAAGPDRAFMPNAPFMRHGEWVLIPTMAVLSTVLGAVGFSLAAHARRRKGSAADRCRGTEKREIETD